jgi:hypothetical protein
MFQPDGLTTDVRDSISERFRSDNVLPVSATSCTPKRSVATVKTGTVFGAPLTQEGICVAKMLIDYLSKDDGERQRSAKI